MRPHSEMVHWLFAANFLLLGLIMLSRVIAGEEVWAMRNWRVYLPAAFFFASGVLLWPVMAFYTNSAIHMIAHGTWAQAMMLAGGAELGLIRGKLHSRWWRLTMPFGLAISGTAFLVHEQNPWFFARSAFLHHLIGWTLVGAALFPLGLVFRPKSTFFQSGFALFAVAVAVMLFCDRDIAPVFGHLSSLAGIQHR